MKTKIADALRTRYANLGLGEKAFNGVASYLEKTITSEDQIESLTTDESVRNLLIAIQGETDSLRTARSSAEKQLAELKKQIETNVPQPAQQGADPEITKKFEEMIAKQSALEAKIAEGEKKARNAALMGEVEEIMKKNGAVNPFFLKTAIKNVEIGDSDTAASIAEKCKAVYDSNYKEAFGEGYIPPKGAPHAEGYQKGDNKWMVDFLKKSGELKTQ